MSTQEKRSEIIRGMGIICIFLVCVAIATGLTSVTGFIFQQYRSGSLVPSPSGSQLYTTNAAGTVTISSPAAGVIQTSDVIRLVSFQ